MVKYHLYLDRGVACGRSSKVITDKVNQVTCLNCQKQPEFIEARAALAAQREADFQAQTPRHIVPQFGRVNENGVMECHWCKGVLFRERPRSLFSYNYVCEGCGKTTSPPTETGMCT